jgi:hypothetical protein
MIDFKVRQASNGVVFPEAKDNERLIEFMRTFHFEIENSHE